MRAVASARTLRFGVTDRVQNTSCPPGAGSATCYLLSGRATAPGFGRVTLGPLLDVEVDPSDPRCHARTTADETLQFLGATVRVRIAGPTLCLGETGTVDRTFTVLGGSGVLDAASGSGHAPITILPEGASESWQGEIAAPSLPPPVKPSLVMLGAKASRAGRSDRITVRFRAHSAGWPPLVTYRASVRCGRAHAAKSGALGSGGTRTILLTVRRAAPTIWLRLRARSGSGVSVALHRRLAAR